MTSSHTPAPRCQWFSALAKALDPRSAPRLAVLLLGVVLSHGRRTLSRWIRVAGLSAQYRRCYATAAAVGHRTQRIATPGFQRITPPHIDIKASAGRQTEGFIDVAHFAWIHHATFADRTRPEVPQYAVTRRPAGFRAEYVSTVSNFPKSMQHRAPEDDELWQPVRL